eukprot:4208984-Lingulodinium_polyedra.AAC.1
MRRPPAQTRFSRRSTRRPLRSWRRRRGGASRRQQESNRSRTSCWRIKTPSCATAMSSGGWSRRRP